MSGWRYSVTVWNNTNGDIVKYHHEISEDELEELEKFYADEPWLEVVVDDRWEVAPEEAP
jgi:hypothetical protein